MSKFTLTFETDSAAFEQNGTSAEVEYVLKRLASFRAPTADYPIEEGVSEKGRVIDSNGATIGTWEYEA